MRRFKQIEYGFNRIEGLSRYLYKKRVPVGHGSVPQTWKLKRLNGVARMRLMGNKALRSIYKIIQLIGSTSVIESRNHHVDWVEMSRLVHDL